MKNFAPAPNAHADPEFVKGLFGKIAKRYDQINTVLSAGMDKAWRSKAGEIVRTWAPLMVLDIATGSGALAAAIKQKNPEAEVIGADYCLALLRRSKDRSEISGRFLADALSLPFLAESVDVVTVAFGLRNMASYSGAISEMHRVLRPGGHVLILDFSLPANFIWRWIYRGYLHVILPWFAGILSGQPYAYRYLAESIEKFPKGQGMFRLLESCGFESPSETPLAGGVVSIYCARKG